MEYRNLGKSGLKVSVIGLGTNNFGRRMDAKASVAVVHRALDEGINFIDTANGYGGGLSEEYIGKALDGRRNEAVLATKVGFPPDEGSSRRNIMKEVEKSLKALKTDHIDFYQIHIPDPNTPIEETLRTLDDLIRQGKVRYIGCSNFSAWQTCESLWVSKSLGLNRFISNQVPYSLFDRAIEAELMPFARQYGFGIIPYFPLASGLLTGKYRRREQPAAETRLAGDDKILTDANFDKLERLETFAAERGHTILELAFAWLLANPLIASVIAGATKPEQVSANAKCFGWELNADDLEAMDRVMED